MSFGAFFKAIYIFFTLVRCGPLIDLCRGPHVRHTGKIKAMKIYKVKPSKHIFCSFFYYFYLCLSIKAQGRMFFSLHSVHRTRLPTGRAVLTWRLCRGSTGSLSQIPRCWRNGSAFRRRPRIETIARLAKWVTAKVPYQANQKALKHQGLNNLISLHYAYIFNVSSITNPEDIERIHLEDLKSILYILY